MLLSIIIPTFNRGVVFQQTIRAAITAVQGLDAEILVVNDYKNGAPDMPVTNEQVRLMSNPKAGVASARNFGAANTTGTLLLFLDDDVLITRENLERTLELYREHPEWCVNPNWVYPEALQREMDQSKFGRYLRHYQYDSLQGWRKTMTWQEDQPFAAGHGASYYLAIPRAIFNSMNGYDERFPFSGAEDYEFMERLRKAGVPVMIDPLSMVYHNESDRLDMDQWLARKERTGTTRRLAADFGYADMALHYEGLKKYYYRIVNQCYPILKGLFSILPNATWCDALSIAVIDRLHAIRLYRGYTAKKL
ncbi:MAG: glycosyltransferase [Chitinophagales bacterium]